MGQYIGVDLHEKTSFVTRVNEKGKVLEQVNLKNDPETLKSFFKKQPVVARWWWKLPAIGITFTN